MATRTNPKIVAQYRKLRRNGYSPSHAMSAARALVKWRAAEAAGYVRLAIEPDPYADWSTYTEEDGYTKEEIDRLMDDGAWGSVGQYRLDPDSDDWEQADSVWGHIGYRDPGDPYENWYIPDVMAETLAALKAALRDRCPACHGTGMRSAD